MTLRLEQPNTVELRLEQPKRNTVLPLVALRNVPQAHVLSVDLRVYALLSSLLDYVGKTY